MKILKKLAALSVAASMVIGTLSITSYAEDMYKIYVDAPEGSVGETVDVKVTIDAGNTGIGAISFMMNYDPTELELVSAKPGNDLNGWITADLDDDNNNSFNLDVPGKIGFAYTTMGKGFLNKSAVLILASFKVLKPNAAFTLTDAVVGADDMDGTDITEQGSSEGATVKCSHKNTDIKTTPATCKDDGKKETVCKDCGTVVKTETIPSTGEHDWEEEITKPATCTEKGSKTLTCKVCGDTKTEEIPALDHDWDDGKITTEPTCTEKGVKTFTCTRCSNTRTEEVEALGHSWDEGKITIEPTCTENGVKTFTCTKCNETRTEDVPAIGHDWGEWKVTKEATTEAEGEETRECENCGEKETRAIAKLPAESITTSYSGGGFFVPETTTSTAAPAESETVTSAITTQAPAITQAPETTSIVTAAAVTTVPVTDNTSVGTQDNISIGNADSENNNIGNANDKNIPTGMVLAVVPAIAAAAGVVIFKKRK